ncbi:60S ribosome subunit biogenesis protein NIP7 [Penicillium taxi]|uniref:60S ribosome subunit biogenesis protein NIP7 n=1 Tax=Penicillium taxi TaxID=168475 RepID=UPI0025457543|nr:60S ribosome subunit biogenesis protein NIP7 [Penicillium taxi]KAJ5894718.1 60S ribosome subunit biogenesis protein NIP7 [Penicillium taxi]
MRQLTEEETKVKITPLINFMAFVIILVFDQTLFTKLANYVGRGITQLIQPPSEDASQLQTDQYVFRLQGSRVYYMPLRLANLAVSIPRDNLLCVGTQIGKFTKTGKFRLNITALDVIAPYARYKAWIKPNGEMPWLYGGNALKAHIGRWSEDCPEHTGVVVFSMDDKPLGFGVTARSTAEARKLEPTSTVIFRQADCGEWLREEDTLFTT